MTGWRKCRDINVGSSSFLVILINSNLIGKILKELSEFLETVYQEHVYYCILPI